MTCLPKIRFPDVVARFRAIQTCYFYPGMRIRFTWTSDGLLQWEENARMTQTQHTHKQCKHIHTHTCTRRHIPRHTHRKIAGCGIILIRTADGCKIFLFSPFFFFNFQGQLLTAALSATLILKPSLWVSNISVKIKSAAWWWWVYSSSSQTRLQGLPRADLRLRLMKTNVAGDLLALHYTLLQLGL